MKRKETYSKKKEIGGSKTFGNISRGQCADLLKIAVTNETRKEILRESLINICRIEWNYATNEHNRDGAIALVTFISLFSKYPSASLLVLINCQPALRDGRAEESI